jgi:hypothetical protein
MSILNITRIDLQDPILRSKFRNSISLTKPNAGTRVSSPSRAVHRLKLAINGRHNRDFTFRHSYYSPKHPLLDSLGQAMTRVILLSYTNGIADLVPKQAAVKER